ncbi:MAG: hypothetical protein GY820_28415 [Gammaproteobacteria bacterium]|nr:hypothetical protein [Gammaproteobacteria bacterium]
MKNVEAASFVGVHKTSVDELAAPGGGAKKPQKSGGRGVSSQMWHMVGMVAH